MDDDIENRKKVGNMKTERSDPLEKVLSLTTRLTKFLYSNSLLKENYHNLQKLSHMQETKRQLWLYKNV